MNHVERFRAAIDGRPYFSIYELDKLVQGLGGLATTRTALDDFRAFIWRSLPAAFQARR